MKKYPILYFLFACFLFTNTLQAQRTGENEKISNEEKKQTIESISTLLGDNYVYPKVAEKMSAHLRQQFNDQAYESITDARVFAGQLSEDLVSISNDKHLRVNYDPRTAAYMSEVSEEDEGPMPREAAVRQASKSNFGFREVKILPGNVGYIDLRGFAGFPEATPTAVGAMNFVGHTDALIIDLRQNGGGSPAMIRTLTSYFFDGEDSVHLNTFYWRPTDEYNHFYTDTEVQGKRMDKTDLYVLISGRTFSAAEEFTYNLKNLQRATIVGETTGGGAHPGGTRPINEKYVMFVPMGKAINPITQTNWEGTGIDPHIEAPTSDALDVAHIEALKKIKENATSDEDRSMIEWTLAGLEAKANPVTLGQELMQSYAGSYGPRQIKFADGKLVYQRGDNPPYAMIPLSENMFGFEELDYFRLEIVKEGNTITGLRGHYSNGRTDQNARDK